MPSIDKSKNANKKRLGRGLGSLLSTDMQDFEDTKKEPVAKPAPKVEPKVEQKPKIETKVVAKPTVKKAVKAPVPQAKKPQQPIVAAPKMPAKAEVKPQVPAPVPTKAPENKGLEVKNRIWSLPIDKVIPNKTQPRKDFLKDPLQELASSIKEQGLLQPVTVRKIGDEYEIIAGERRWRASQLAGLHEIPAIIKEVSDQKSMELALIENIQRENLNPVEEAMAYQLLMDDYDLSQQEVAKKVGKERSSVANSLRILTLPRDVRQMVRQGLVSMGHAKVLVGVEDPKEQVKLARKSIQKKLSVRALEKEVKKNKGDKLSGLGELDVSQRLAHGLASDLQKVLGTKVSIQYKKGKGKVEVSFYSDEELSDFCEKIKTAWHQSNE